jgi:hypothetical protein
MGGGFKPTPELLETLKKSSVEKSGLLKKKECQPKNFGWLFFIFSSSLFLFFLMTLVFCSLARINT